MRYGMKFGNFTKIAICWTVLTVGGVYAFVLSKQNIDKNRYEHMKVRERIKRANEGEYEPSARKFSRDNIN